MNKLLIKQRFEKVLSIYNDNATIQKRMAKKLIQLASKDSFDNILEIGCGTGLLTQEIINNFSFRTYIANDLVEKCEKYISEISEKILFISDDIENFLKYNNKKYDLIISNATFQWIENPQLFISSLMKNLNPNGIILFSTFGTRNFKEILEVTGESLLYKSIEEHEELFKEYTVNILEEVITLDFESPKDVLMHIKSTGVNAIKSNTWTRNDIENFSTKYNKICNQKPTLTYNPIYIKIIK